jgi:DNA-binding MarR family transcriptional regulator
MKEQETKTTKFTPLFSNEIKTSVMVALDNIGSANLSQLAKLVGRTKSTLHSHVRDLLSEGYIELDVGMSQDGWGKFYRLTEVASAKLSGLKNQVDKSAEAFKHLKDRNDYADMIREAFEGYSVLTGDQLRAQMQFFAKYYLNVVELASNTSANLLEYFKNGLHFPTENIYLGSYDNGLVSLPITNVDQLKRYKATFSRFYDELHGLAHEFKVENQENQEKLKNLNNLRDQENQSNITPDIQTVFISGCPVNLSIEDLLKTI